MSKINYYNPKNNFPQEAIGKEPNWILKSGISILAGTILIVVAASIFIKYPDRLASSIVITTNTSPVKISSLTTGTIQDIYVSDGDTINKGDTLYYINKNETNLTHLSKVKNLLKLGKDSILNLDLTGESFLLGDVQEYYQDFTQTIINYKEYLEYSPDSLQIVILKNTLNKYNRLKKINATKIELNNQRLGLEKSKMERQNELFKKGVISTQEKESFDINYLQIVEGNQELQKEQTNIEITLLEINDQINELEQKKKNIIKKFEKEFYSKRDYLLNAINVWENSHLIKAPINGKVVYLKHDILNTSIELNDDLLAIIPISTQGIVGKMFSPIYNSGKIKEGSKVNIFLDNYPYQEYGIVSGVVKSISSIPYENQYLVKVTLPNGLQTNQTEIPFTQELSGSAEIVLNKKSLFDRLFEKIISLDRSN